MLSLAYHFQPQQILYGYFSLNDFQEYVAGRALNVVTIDGQNFCDVLLERLNSGKIQENPNGEIEFQDGRCITFDTLCQEFSNEYGYFYDEEEQKYWIDKELCEKAKIVKKELGSNGISR